MSESTKGKMRVAQVYTYPIKSLRGIAAASLSAMYTGFPHDRRFMLFNVADAKNMHVAEYTEMCLFTTAFDVGEEQTDRSPNNVIVTYTQDHAFARPEEPVDRSTLDVPLDPDTTNLSEMEITMHSSPCTAFAMGGQYDTWFSDRFGYQVKFLYIGNSKRKVLGNMPPKVAAQQREASAAASGRGTEADPGSSWLSAVISTASSLVGGVMGFADNGEGEYEGVDDGISFADVAPYLIISTKSWENAQRRLAAGAVMDISKFRPNIIVEGAESDFEEDFWAELSIGPQETKFMLTQNCARCNSINIDYSTGKVALNDSGKMLKKLQADRRVDPGAKWSPVFGRYGFLGKVPEGRSATEIRVGDEVRVVKRNTQRMRFEWPFLST